MAATIFSYNPNLLVRESKQDCHSIDCEVHNIQTAPEFNVQSTPAPIPKPEEAGKRKI
jgi:hypothetical protein